MVHIPKMLPIPPGFPRHSFCHKHRFFVFPLQFQVKSVKSPLFSWSTSPTSTKGLAAAHLLRSGSRLSYPFGVAIVATLWPWQRLGLTSRTRGVPAYRSNSLELSNPIAADPISRSHVQISCVNTAHWFSSYVFKLASLQFCFLLI